MKKPDLRFAKKRANVRVNSDLMAQIRALEIDPSSTLEYALDVALADKRRNQWLAENRDAIAAYNDHVSKHGTFGDRMRSF